MPPKMAPFDGLKGPCPVKGVAWQFDQVDKVWTRHVMRVYSDKEVYWSKTHRLTDAGLPFCLNCLSNNVTYEGHAAIGGEHWYCHDCPQGQFRIIP